MELGKGPVFSIWVTEEDCNPGIENASKSSVVTADVGGTENEHILHDRHRHIS